MWTLYLAPGPPRSGPVAQSVGRKVRVSPKHKTKLNPAHDENSSRRHFPFWGNMHLSSASYFSWIPDRVSPDCLFWSINLLLTRVPAPSWLALLWLAASNILSRVSAKIVNWNYVHEFVERVSRPLYSLCRDRQWRQWGWMYRARLKLYTLGNAGHGIHYWHLFYSGDEICDAWGLAASAWSLPTRIVTTGNVIQHHAGF